MIRILVADDEPLARDELIYLLHKTGKVETIAEASNGEEALARIRQTHPDAVFLDIDMPKMDGLAVARNLLQEEEPPIIVFATAYDSHAVKAFELNAIDYVLKPFEEERINVTVARIIKGINNMSTEKLTKVISDVLREENPQKPKLSKIAVEKEDSLVLLDPEDIIYLYREGREVYVKTRDQVYSSKHSLQAMEEKMARYDYYRTHRAYLVNLTHIEELVPWFNGAYTIIMKDNERSRIPVSRFYAKELKEIFGII
ncbi:MAG: hypothetical protein APF84_01370 [Gracilibacter sp. BRH_c7a]|nr:MAG: hypothetical protein APF84_01370 [Gracilibacter sp. BRH_c7a]